MAHEVLEASLQDAYPKIESALQHLTNIAHNIENLSQIEQFVNQENISAGFENDLLHLYNGIKNARSLIKAWKTEMYTKSQDGLVEYGKYAPPAIVERD